MLVYGDTLKYSPMYIGYIILKEFQRKKSDKISLMDITKALRDANMNSHRQFILGLSFLFFVGIIDFKEDYIWVIS
ncbi:MAG: hypothetical protein LUH02_01295 [Erysipelotrichaceae bacterium]|nr:hypothetical protein [Erysipelotrichaceae bacterium]